MYKIKVECSGKPCEIILSSISEIQELENKGATVTIISPVKPIVSPVKPKQQMTPSQIQTMVKTIKAIPINDECLDVEKYKYESNSCYMDSLLFALFSVPTKFVESYIINVDMSKLRRYVSALRVYDVKISTEDTTKIMDYIQTVHNILLEVRNKYAGTIEQDYCRNLRPILLKDPIHILDPAHKKPFASKNQEDVGEFLQAIFKTFYISNVDMVEEKSYLNSSDSSIYKVSDKVVRSEAPFYILYPGLTKTKLSDLSIESEERLDETEYVYDEARKPKDPETLKKLEELRKLQVVAMITKTVAIIVSHNKESIFDGLRDTDYEDIPQQIKDKKQLYIVVAYTLDELIRCYNLLTVLSDKFYDTNISPEMKAVRKNPALKYYQSQQEINRLIKYYYDIIIRKESYVISGKEEDNFMVINVNRFANAPAKDTSVVQISNILNIDKSVLELSHIVAHSGSSLKSGHYTTAFKCNGFWYKYDDLSENITKLGSFDELNKIENGFYTKNSVLLFYY
jgi:ubiquitin C-terminal hydrolase